jgi:hypothetical protein
MGKIAGKIAGKITSMIREGAASFGYHAQAE